MDSTFEPNSSGEIENWSIFPLCAIVSVGMNLQFEFDRRYSKAHCLYAIPFPNCASELLNPFCRLPIQLAFVLVCASKICEKTHHNHCFLDQMISIRIVRQFVVRLEQLGDSNAVHILVTSIVLVRRKAKVDREVGSNLVFFANSIHNICKALEPKPACILLPTLGNLVQKLEEATWGHFVLFARVVEMHLPLPTMGNEIHLGRLLVCCKVGLVQHHMGTIEIICHIDLQGIKRIELLEEMVRCW